MEPMPHDTPDYDEDDALPGYHRPEDSERRQKRHEIRRGIEDYFERKVLDRLDDWYDFD